MSNKTKHMTNAQTKTQDKHSPNEYGIIHVKNIDLDRITFSEPKKNKRNGINVNIMYDGTPLKIQLPRLRVPFGAQPPYGSESKPESELQYQLEFSLGSLDDNKSIENCKDKLDELDEYIKKSAKKYCEEWFGDSTLTDSIIKIFYKNIVRVSKKVDKEGKPYAPTVRTKLPLSLNTDSILIFDSDKNVMNDTEESPTSLFKKGDYVVPVVKFSSLWFMDKSFGVSGRLMQAQVFSGATKKLTSFSIEAEDSDSEADVEEEVALDSVNESDNEVNDSDNEVNGSGNEGKDSDNEGDSGNDSGNESAGGSGSDSDTSVPEEKPEPKKKATVKKTKAPAKKTTTKSRGRKKTDDLLKEKLK